MRLRNLCLPSPVSRGGTWVAPSRAKAEEADEIAGVGFDQLSGGGPRAAKKNLTGGLAARICKGAKTNLAPSATEPKTPAGDAVPT
jgi:hypothetical protein